MTELALRLYDTLTKTTKLLSPKRDGEVRIYTCGPTVYDDAHVGHARAALAPDTLVRHLRALGLKVTYARNITDVDDKILQRSSESGEEPTALSARMAERYHEDIRALGCVEPEVEPKVSEHIAQIIATIERIIEHGAGYVVDLGGGVQDVYFAVRSFAGYGKLSGRKLEDMRVGARVEASEHKRDPLDFALWKGCSEDGWGWPSPWGKGRPGWHIECSAMSAEYLGHGFDVHCGGMDLIFPHHENEIAQAEAACPDGGDFVGLWMHNGFVNVDKEKMAKSLGNFVTIRDVYRRYDPEALRYFLLGVHYRGPIGFDTDKRDDGRVVFPGIAEAERRLDYLYGTVERLTDLATEQGEPTAAGAKPPKEIGAARRVVDEAPGKLCAALDDDLNTPVALAVLAELGTVANEICDLAQKRRKDARFRSAARALATDTLAAIREAGGRLGVLETEPAEYRRRTQTLRLSLAGLSADAIEEKIAARKQARKDKDFAAADGIRDELVRLGVELADTPTGTIWHLAVI
ncbi:MAG: cysteine--tRNA ligase [Deltaproteobacteria bacterium]|jgi:cysteinyl-tRNA synthetase|nr:cysteine--tRNA ligase [Deltaproteobacteria bacterium]MBW2531162.1 cysteine--tRNA ligase [Deltaproteobacteria bacterium]